MEKRNERGIDLLFGNKKQKIETKYKDRSCGFGLFVRILFQRRAVYGVNY